MDKFLRGSLQCNVFGVGQESTRQAAGFPPFLPNNGIHAWSALYRDLELHYEILSGTTSQEEQYAASLFRNDADSRKYILRHGLLRIILGNYTHRDPERVSFSTGKNGKPELVPHGGYTVVSFNLSHTSEMVIIGIARTKRIGIDIVKMDPLYQYYDIAEYILTPAEKAFMQGVEPAQKHQAFFRIWALKEAILKTNGDSISMMKDTDTSDIIQKGFSFPCCSLKYRKSLPPFFIWQFRSGLDHCGAIAAEIGSASLNED
jgi:4'-phosphopantetheinyl transferase